MFTLFSLENPWILKYGHTSPPTPSKLRDLLYRWKMVCSAWSLWYLGFHAKVLDLVIFLEVEGHFCPLDYVMALEWIGWRSEGRRVFLSQSLSIYSSSSPTDEKKLSFLHLFLGGFKRVISSLLKSKSFSFLLELNKVSILLNGCI